MNLSIEQKKVVHADIKAIQVLASAGTGKTRVLTERIRYLIKNSKKDKVIALTFTNKSAEEMRERLSDIEIQERTWISTIHSVAQRILEQYGSTIGLPTDLHIFERDMDRMEIFLQSLTDNYVDINQYLETKTKDREKKLRLFMSQVSHIKKEMLTDDEIISKYDQKTLNSYHDYQNALLESNGIDYDDILNYAHQILVSKPNVARIYQRLYQHICVDEAQDMNKAQYQFIKALCGDVITSVLMVGDPKQMIYGFNGSSESYFLTNFKEDFEPVKAFKLTNNYRSSQAIIDTVNKIMPTSQQSSHHAFQGKVCIQGFNNEQEEAESIIKEIQSLLKLGSHTEIEEKINLENIAVLARNRFVLMKLEDVLNSKKIPYYLKIGERKQPPETDFGKVLDFAIRVKINSKNWVDGRKLCRLLKFNYPDKEFNLIDISEHIDSSLPYFDIYKKLIQSIAELETDKPHVRNFVQQMKKYLTDTPQPPEDNQIEEINAQLKELEIFEMNWNSFKRQGLGESLGAFHNAIALGKVNQGMDEHGLTLSSVHNMKGLERDIVFVMGMCEGVFPDYRAVSGKALDEEKNNVNVAFTRAKRWLYISYPKSRVMPWGDSKDQSRSQFLRDIESINCG